MALNISMWAGGCAVNPPQRTSCLPKSCLSISRLSPLPGKGLVDTCGHQLPAWCGTSWVPLQAAPWNGTPRPLRHPTATQHHAAPVGAWRGPGASDVCNWWGNRVREWPGCHLLPNVPVEGPRLPAACPSPCHTGVWSGRLGKMSPPPSPMPMLCAGSTWAQPHLGRSHS